MNSRIILFKVCDGVSCLFTNWRPVMGELLLFFSHSSIAVLSYVWPSLATTGSFIMSWVMGHMNAPGIFVSFSFSAILSSSLNLFNSSSCRSSWRLATLLLLLFFTWSCKAPSLSIESLSLDISFWSLMTSLIALIWSWLIRSAFSKKTSSAPVIYMTLTSIHVRYCYLHRTHLLRLEDIN